MHGQAAHPGPVDAAVGGEGAVAGDAELAAVRVPGQQQVVPVGREQVHHRLPGRVQDAEPQVGRRVGGPRDQVVAVPVGVRVVHPGQRDVEAAAASWPWWLFRSSQPAAASSPPSFSQGRSGTYSSCSPALVRQR